MSDMARGLAPQDTVDCKTNVTMHVSGAKLRATAIANEVGVMGGKVKRMCKRATMHGTMVAGLTDG